MSITHGLMAVEYPFKGPGSAEADVAVCAKSRSMGQAEVVTDRVLNDFELKERQEATLFV